MIQHDYLLRLIEEFTRALARIAELRRVGPEAAAPAVDRELQQLLSLPRADLVRLSTMELLARIIRTGTALEARVRMFYLVSLLKEDGDLATAAGDAEAGRASHIKALRLLFDLQSPSEAGEAPQFVPGVEALAGALEAGAAPLPEDVQAGLMQHYERLGDFGRAEDALFGLLGTGPVSPEALAFGTAYYRRLLEHNDTTLIRGRLPREEVLTGLAELQSRSTVA